MRTSLLLALTLSVAVAACTISEPLPEPSLSYHRVTGDNDERMDYYWDEDTALISSPEFGSYRIDVSAELRDQLLLQLSDARNAIYRADLDGGAVAPNCTDDDADVQTICQALSLAGERFYAQVIHPNDVLLASESFLYVAPTSLRLETAEMIVLLSETYAKSEEL